MSERVDCRISFGGLLGLARAHDHYLALMPSLRDKEDFEDRLQPWVYKCMTPHHARILVRGGRFVTSCGAEVSENQSSMTYPEEDFLSRVIDFEHLKLVTPAHDGPLVARPDVVSLSALTSSIPVAHEDRRVSRSLFRPVYRKSETRVVGKIRLRPTKLMTGGDFGEHRFYRVPGPPVRLTGEVYFETSVERADGVRLNVRKLWDTPETECEIKIVPSGECDRLRVHFENSPTEMDRPWSPDFAVHYNLFGEPQRLQGRLPFPLGPHDPWDDCKHVYRASDPQCSPADYGDVGP